MVVSPLSSARFPVPLDWGTPPAPEAVPAARWLVGAIVREWGVPLADDALRDLELCANALLHTGDRCAVTVLRRPGRLRVEVFDRCPALPRRERGVEATGGRGLLLVEVLADAWGWYPQGDGKVVWFEFPEQHEAPCPTHGWGTALGLVLSSRVAC
ncbi:ATP-binding protein [Kitasatospora purpeofusca]|uniref:ATP-binding protein n=1 Tax=Kitasatospora purpeofusca TaxID=67352 RepID=UPI0022515C00|nr:ATP-binding protein [Kitasatospora purpeofusca]MCX4758503.1 ATP-binding protein [Kitasatospora purpeofusca]WSR31052.1 ATP-binding protein [Kitasatospora purpeofusca]WSR39086.1 ATP-binding protein [Kitasatospora purpeofusca]